jgi:hypothetical protein
MVYCKKSFKNSFETIQMFRKGRESFRDMALFLSDTVNLKSKKIKLPFGFRQMQGKLKRLTLKK